MRLFSNFVFKLPSYFIKISLVTVALSLLFLSMGDYLFGSFILVFGLIGCAYSGRPGPSGSDWDPWDIGLEHDDPPSGTLEKREHPPARQTFDLCAMAT